MISAEVEARRFAPAGEKVRRLPESAESTSLVSWVVEVPKGIIGLLVIFRV